MTGWDPKQQADITAIRASLARIEAALKPAAPAGAPVATTDKLPYPLSPLVTISGTSFIRDGRPWVPRAVNRWDLLDADDATIVARVKAIAAAGADLIRTWAFRKDGSINAHGMQVAADAARAAGILLLFDLANQWSDWGGPDRFGLTQDSWYRSGLQRDWAAQVVAACTALRGHAGVLGYEPVNEIRPNMDPVSMGWGALAYALIREADPSHLVGNGAEGFSPGLYPAPNAQSGASVDLSADNLNFADFLTGHLYPKYTTPDLAVQLAPLTAVIAGWAGIAKRLGKPFLIAEAGVDPRDTPRDPAALTHFATWVPSAARSVGIGAALWAIADADDGSFGLALSSPAVKAWLA